MKLRSMTKALALLGCAGFALGCANVAQASAFQLWETGGNIGVGHAGDAAYASDASTAFSNPAGMVRLHHVAIAGGLVGIKTDVRFNGSTSVAEKMGTTTLPIYARSGISNGSDTNYIPNGHIVVPVNNRFALGLSMVVPLGLDTSYDLTSPVAPMATKSTLQGFDINPSIGIKINDKWSIGFGLNAEHIKADFDQNTVSGEFKNHFTDWGYGYNAGVLFQASPSIRVGLTYRSKINHNATGTSDLAGTKLNNASTTLIYPGTTTLSYFQQINSKWAVLSSVIYTQWSAYKALEMKGAAPAKETINAPQNFRNTWNVELGGMYNVTPKWRLEAGLGYDQSPVTTKYRTVQVPDNNRFTLSLGAHWQPTENLGVEIGYAHFFIKRSDVNSTITVPFTPAISIASTSTGFVDSSANNFGIQFTYKFA